MTRWYCTDPRCPLFDTPMVPRCEALHPRECPECGGTLDRAPFTPAQLLADVNDWWPDDADPETSEAERLAFYATVRTAFDTLHSHRMRRRLRSRWQPRKENP